jgi:threonine dehydrogenase-like Zn-dependent dehydrogenase
MRQSPVYRRCAPWRGSDFFLVNARYAVKIPAGVSEDDAAMVEPLAERYTR